MAKKKLLAAILALTGVAMAQGAAAVDIYPGDYTVLPPGVTVGLGYLGYTPSNEFKLAGVGRIPGSSIDQTVGIVRVLHYSSWGELPVAYQAFLPFAQLSNARVGGGTLPVNNGVGDLTVGFTVFPIATKDPQYGTTLGITQYVSLPTGTYDLGYAQPGAGSVVYTPQIGLIQGLGHGFFLDLSYDKAMQLSHTRSGHRIEHGSANETQAYLRYQFSAATSLSVGYAQFSGGKLFVDDVFQGQEVKSRQVRLYGSHMLAPTWQLSGMVGKAISADGGFKNTYTAQLRLMKIF